MHIYIRGVFIVCLMTLSVNSYGWNFSEHRELGMESFLGACNSLIEEYKSNSEEFSEHSKYANLIMACSNIDAKARLYGIRSALSGDHIESPEDFENINAELQALSVIHYGEMALGNHQHFWPGVKNTWRKYHELAIQYSMKARNYMDNNQTTNALTALEKAYAYSAFSDHFLQDSFSMGHVGFSRVNSLQNPSLIAHEYWSDKGRYFKGNKLKENNILTLGEDKDSCNEIKTNDGIILKEKDTVCDTDIWFANGDNKLNDETNTFNRKKIVLANIDSIKSVILTFVHGDDKDYSLRANMQFPIATEGFINESLYGEMMISGEMSFKPASERKDHSCDNNGVVDKDDSINDGFCWLDIEGTYTEAVYPDATIRLDAVSIPDYDISFIGLHYAHSLYFSKVKSWMPMGLRVYLNTNITDLDDSSVSNNPRDYSEIGFNYVLPNFYQGTPFSHEIEIGKVSMNKDIWFLYREKNETIEHGGYLGFNTNIDILRAKLTAGLGWYLPNWNLSEHIFKGQIMIGWEFGVIGGGPLRKW